MKQSYVTFDLQTPEVLQFEDVTIAKEDRQSFAFRPDLKYHRLQRFLFWCLRKLGVYRKYSEKGVQTVIINLNEVERDIIQHIIDVEERFNVRIKTVFVGREEFFRLARIGLRTNPGAYYGFHMETRTCRTTADETHPEGRRTETFINGIRVVVLPWLNGIVVSPE